MSKTQENHNLSGVHVAVFGLGGVGSWCAEALARAGVGRLTLVDDDMVSPAHLDSQAQATCAALGQPKAIALAVHLRDINPQGTYTPKCYRYSAQGREDFFPADYDYVVDAMGPVPCKLDLIETAQNQGIPVVSALDLGGLRDASQLQIGELADLAHCPPAQALRDGLAAKGIEQLKVVFSPASAPQSPQPAPWVPPVAGFLLAQAVLQEVSE
jgi:tRNA A37 threonylcarbamoyladenosine dehydratase